MSPRHVASVRPGLGAEAGRERGIAQWQLLLVEHFVGVQVNQGHLAGRDQVTRIGLDLEHFLLELGQLAAAEQALALDQVGRRNLGVAMLLGVQVEHEGAERPLQSCPPTEVGGEPGTGKLGAALEVEDPELRADVPVGLRLEVELRQIADHPLDAVRRLVAADRDRLVSDVRYLQLRVDELLLGLRHDIFKALDAGLELRHL